MMPLIENGWPDLGSRRRVPALQSLESPDVVRASPLAKGLDMASSPRPADPYAARWKMLALISLGFVAMTLNWFDIAPRFPRSAPTSTPTFPGPRF
jgi:hypothetical protein